MLALSLFSTCMDWIMDRAVGGSGCGVSFGEVLITDLDFADDAVIFAETPSAFVMRFPPTDQAHKILRAGKPRGWRRPRKRWLKQLEENLVNVRVTGLASDRIYAKRSPGEWKVKVDTAKRQPGACPIHALPWVKHGPITDHPTIRV